MTQESLVHAIVAFFSDAKFATVAALIVVDFVLGIAAAFRLGTFRLSYVSDFLRNDLLNKVVPWGVVYIADKLSHGATLVAGIDLGDAAMALWVVMVAALGGSILSSLAHLGVSDAPGPDGAPRAVRGTLDRRYSRWQAIFGGENAGPPKD